MKTENRTARENDFEFYIQNVLLHIKIRMAIIKETLSQRRGFYVTQGFFDLTYVVNSGICWSIIMSFMVWMFR